MLRTDNNKYRDPFENCFDPGLFQFSAELKKVDVLLNDSGFFQPFREKFGSSYPRARSTENENNIKSNIGLGAYNGSRLAVRQKSAC